MAGKLNRNGFESNRNLNKPWKPPRIVKDDKIHPLDNLPLKANGDHVLSNGTMGIKSTFGIRVKQYGPPGRRRDKRKKHGCRLASTCEIKGVDDAMLARMIGIRRKLLTIKVIGKAINRELLTQELRVAFDRISNYVSMMLSEPKRQQLREMDEHQSRSIAGRIKNQGINRVSLHDLIGPVRAAMKYIKA